MTRSKIRSSKKNKKVKLKVKGTIPPKGLYYQRWFWVIVGVLILTVVSFSTSLPNDFVYWDDDRNILENTLVNSFAGHNFWQNTIEIFSTTIIGNYNPLSIFTFGLENMIFGIDQPYYWHLDNLILHLIGIILVFRIGTLLGLNLLGAGIFSLLFAIHPMRVESVAWITERKDVLYGALFLGAIYQYIQFKISGAKKKLWWMTGFFILSLFAKIQAVTFPLVMILIDYLMDKEINWKKVINKWPYFLMSLAVGITGISILNMSGSLEANEAFPLWQRIFIGSYSFVIYLIKSVVPFRLSPLYPYPAVIPSYFYPTLIIAPLYLGTIYWSWKKGFKELTFGLAFFLVNIVLLLQILGAGQGFIADRFTYIAYLGLFFIAAFYIQKLAKNSKWGKSIKYTSLVVIVIYSYLTYNQNKIWKNSDTLWTHVLKFYPKSTLAHGNRANYLRDQGYYQQAISGYNASLKIKPDQSGTLNSRAKLFFSSNNRDTLLMALSDYSKAIQLEPDNAEYYVNKGATLGRLGRMAEALEWISKGIEINPAQLSGYTNRSVIYNQYGQYDKALADIETYLSYNPNNADFWYESGNLKGILGRAAEGIKDIDMGIQINPNRGIYHYRKAEFLLSINQIDNARTALQNALALGYTNIRPEMRQRLLSN